MFCAAFLSVYTGSNSGNAGISLGNALTITSLLNWAVRNSAETESYMNSVERILYTTDQTPQERQNKYEDYVQPSTLINASDMVKKQSTTGMGASLSNNQIVRDTAYAPADTALSTDNRAAAAYAVIKTTTTSTRLTDQDLVSSGWPWRGGIVFQNVSMRYREDFNPVLHNVSFTVRPGENVGIVGRTGSGKSSLFRALLRLNEIESYPFGGNTTATSTADDTSAEHSSSSQSDSDSGIMIDGVDISHVSLSTLRSRISIIPQDAVLFSGTIR